MDLLHPRTVWERNLRSLLIGAITVVATAGAALAGPYYIVGGNTEDGHPAAGALMYNNEQSCTGTLISPRVVLTAAHCLADFNSSQGHSFYIGNNTNDVSSGTVIEITELIPHAEFTNDGNSYDIGLVRLAQDAPISPVGFNSQTMDDDFIGQNPLFVGFGVTSGQTEDSGIKRSVNVPITSFEADGFRYTQPNTGTCFGDSGGPAFLEVDGSLKVIGVTSWGDQDCAEFGVNTRTDLYTDFIQCVVDSGEDCGGRVIDSSGSNDNGPGGDDQEGIPDDWCTDGDGYCDEPCETPDSDCGPDGGTDGGSNSELGPEDGYCIPDDGFCDDWCNPVDTDCDGSDGEQNDEAAEGSDQENSDSSSESDAGSNESPESNEGSNAGQETNPEAGGNIDEVVGEAGVDAGGCSQTSPDGAIWLLLMGAWACLRKRLPRVGPVF